jgi:hypothetical protein
VGKQSRAGSGKQSPIATRIGVGGTPEPQAVVRRTQRGSDRKQESEEQALFYLYINTGSCALRGALLSLAF